MLTIAALCLFLSINESNGKKNLSLRERLFNGNDRADVNNGKRRLIAISFNNKMCIEYGGWNWKTPYSGDYTYNGIINGKPSYIMTTCGDANNCNNGATLSFSDDAWRFSDGPYCEITGAAAPNDCTSWWGYETPDDQPTITPCGSIQTADNGVSQGDTDKQNACIAALAEQPRRYLTSGDKDELLHQFNVQRALWNQPDWSWSPALEAVAQSSVDLCTGDHPQSNELDPYQICVDNGGVANDCWFAGTQGMGGAPSVNGLVWDGYGNGECRLEGSWIGIVWSFMQDPHRWPVTAEYPDKLGGHYYTSVGCAYTYCGDDTYGGYIACNYM